MEKTLTVKVGTGRVVHSAYKNERGTFVGCGVVKHHLNQRMQEVYSEVTCKKCLVKHKELQASVEAPVEVKEEEITIKEWVEKYGKTFIVEK